MRSSTTIAAVRGAISVPRNDAASIRIATSRLISELIRRNHLSPERIVSALFTATPDLTADFPAHAARRLGWTDAPLLCATEIAVPGAPKRIVRVLVTVRDVPRHRRLEPVYLDEAVSLRKDLAHVSDALGPPAPDARRVAIVGLGQIGGSIGLSLARSGRWNRVGFDRSRARARQALAGRAVDELALSLEAACAGAQLIVLAAPVDALPALIARTAAAARKGAVLLDTGSARRGVTAALEAAAARGVLACGGHPLAGNEGRGFAAARADLFEGLPFVLLPVKRSVPPIARALVRDLGAQPLVVDPKTHDAALARTSHLPYVLAKALARVGERAARQHLAGPGFKSATRLAASDPRMAEAYVKANATNVRKAWQELRRSVERQLKALPGR